MKAKLVLILLVVALLCTSIASAGFTEWVTGKAVSLKSLFSRNTATKAEITNTGITNNNAANLPAAGKNTAAKATKVSPTEFDSNIKANELAMLPDNAFWVHVENRLMQADNWITQFDKQDVSGASRNAAANTPITNRNLVGVKA